MDSRGIVWNIKSEGSLASDRNGNRATMSMNDGDVGIYAATNSSFFIYRIRLKMFEKVRRNREGGYYCAGDALNEIRERGGASDSDGQAVLITSGLKRERAATKIVGQVPLWGSWRWKARVVARNRWLAAQHRHKFEQNFARNAEIVAKTRILSPPWEFVKLTRGLYIISTLLTTVVKTFKIEDCYSQLWRIYL